MTRAPASSPGRATAGALAGVAALLLAACGGGPDPAATLDAVAWPPSWELVHRAAEDDTSCGERSCPTEVRYLTADDGPEATCAAAVDALGVDPPDGSGCSLVSCRDGVLVTVNVSGDRQRVTDLAGPDEVVAPSGGSAIGLRARVGC